jgi:hypothetical protein
MMRAIRSRRTIQRAWRPAAYGNDVALRGLEKCAIDLLPNACHIDLERESRGEDGPGVRRVGERDRRLHRPGDRKAKIFAEDADDGDEEQSVGRDAA